MAYTNKQTKWTIETFKASFGFLNESFSSNELEELENIPEKIRIKILDKKSDV